MPVEAADLFAEGFVAAPVRLVRDDRVLDEIVGLFRANSRTPDARSGDLRAQVAGNYTGERRLLELYERYDADTIDAAIERILDESERRMRAALKSIGNGTFAAVDYLEDRSGEPRLRIALQLTLEDGRARLDYTGTCAQVPFPLNAVFGVTLSGVHYALRAVTDPTIPMNEGCFRPVEAIVPEGSLLNPRRPAPVSGGNVETSMRNADVVLQALAQAAPDRVPASSGGTMSNVVLGGTRPNGDTWAFYETNGCGMGARPASDGIECNPLPHDQYAQYADRGDRTRVSAARGALRDRGGNRRHRTPARRQRLDSRDRTRGGFGARDAARGSSHARSAGRARRRAGRRRPPLAHA